MSDLAAYHGLDQHQTASLMRHNFWLGPGPGGQSFLYIPGGCDPLDQAPITHARAATAYEERLWAARLDLDIARILASQGMPVRLAEAPVRSQGWRGWIKGLRRRLGLGGK